MTRKELNVWREHQERLYAMAVDKGDTWDLSDNDQAACNAGGDAIMALLDRDKQAAAITTSPVGETPTTAPPALVALREVLDAIVEHKRIYAYEKCERIIDMDGPAFDAARALLAGDVPPLPTAAPAPELVALVQEWQDAQADLWARVDAEESPDHDQAAANALHVAHRRDEAATEALLAWTPAALVAPPDEKQRREAAQRLRDVLRKYDLKDGIHGLGRDVDEAVRWALAALCEPTPVDATPGAAPPLPTAGVPIDFETTAYDPAPTDDGRFALPTAAPAPVMECRDCDGCGWVEGGRTLKTTCSTCNGAGVVEDSDAR